MQPGFLADVARLYLDQTPGQLEELERASEPGSRARVAHMIKGSSLSLGASSVGTIAAAIEKDARANGATDHWLPSLRGRLRGHSACDRGAGQPAVELVVTEFGGSWIHPWPRDGRQASLAGHAVKLRRSDLRYDPGTRLRQPVAGIVTIERHWLGGGHRAATDPHRGPRGGQRHLHPGADDRPLRTSTPRVP